MPLRAGARLGSYEILALLGAGGMGEVYRARDTKLERDVAIKVLPESVGRDPAALVRFEREAKAVAALSHENILAIHDFGTQCGVAYAVTELLEGETLREKLDAGAISQKQAVEFGVQIARGLSAAHERGVIHRDLKPENLFVSKDGHLKILDFGLSKRDPKVTPAEHTSAPTVTVHTEPGVVMGTVGYMSPEQVRGLPVDFRTDIFSFGAILYELLSRKRAFRKETAADTMSAILNQEPPEMTESQIPVSLDHVVKHCLEKDRDRRFQSARDIEFALAEASGPPAGVARAPIRSNRAFVPAAALLAVAAVAGVLWTRRTPKPPTTAVLKRIAVLPFENLGAPEDEYFADGMSDAVRGKLTALRGLDVIARASSTLYKKTSKTPQQISTELDAPFLLTATVRWDKSGETSRVEVNPELVEVKGSGAPSSRWQRPFEAALTSVFQVQSEIATQVAQSLGVVIGSSEATRLRETPTANMSAYDAFLKGEAVWRMNMGWNVGFDEMIRSYEQAVAIDPGFAEAWARLSRARTHRYESADRTPELAEQALTAAERALALAPNSAEARLAMGEYLYWVRHDGERALKEFAGGQRVAPGNVDLLISRSYVEAMLGRSEAARELVLKASRLDPGSIQTTQLLAGDLADQGRYGEARALLDRALARDPRDLSLIVRKTSTYLAQGDLAGARSVLREASKSVEPTALVAYIANISDLVWVLDTEQRDLLLRLTPSAFESRKIWAICLAQASWLNRDKINVRRYAEEAAKAFQKDLDSNGQDAEDLAFVGLSMAYLGRREEAIRDGEKAVALRPIARGFSDAPYSQHLLARIYTILGEPEKAIDNLEPLIKTSYLTPGWLQIDPNFDPLRGNPRFEKLVAGRGPTRQSPPSP
jgi:eukaryotic-like serine/threonine-protein kinase